MKKLLVICSIIFIVTIFISGCIGGEKVDKTLSSVTPTPSQNIQNSDLIIKQEDLPAGFVLDKNSRKTMILKSSVCTMLNPQNCSKTESEIRDNKIPEGWRYYKDIISSTDPSGKIITINIIVYDSNEGFEKLFKIDGTRKDPSIEKSGYDANIGDYSYWLELTDRDPYLKNSILGFSIKNTFVGISVRDDKENGHDLALRMAKLIAGRLG